ncbi:hypothetical protein RJ640_015787 [Escallonia rubra]|uniref:Protein DETOXIFICATION n=1 Tax=Escallonia rubra TaxID=112253 RepID=A0AA88RLU1_9ASTE|nr:hypothetical protein RJ640_015787 [Escallonia rubra]
MAEVGELPAPQGKWMIPFLVFFKDARLVFKMDDLGLEILRIALPAAMALAADPIASLIDTAFIGHLGPMEIAAVGVSIAIFNQASKVTIFPLVSITTSFVAEEETVGRITSEVSKDDNSEKTSAKNNEMADLVFENLEKGSAKNSKAKEVVPVDDFTTSVTSGSSNKHELKSKRRHIASASTALGSPMLSPAQRYLTLRSLGAPAVLISLAMQGVFRGFKDTKTPLYATGSFLLARVIAVTFCVTLAASLASRLGPTPMAAFQVWMASSLLADGLAVAGQAILACAFAEKDYEKAKAAATRVLQMGFVLGLGLALVVGLGLQFGSGIFSKDKNVISLISIGVPFVAATQPINSVAFVFDGVNFGASDFAYSAYSMVLVAIVSIACLFVLFKANGFVGIWVALTIYMGLRTFAGLWSSLIIMAENGDLPAANKKWTIPLFVFFKDARLVFKKDDLGLEIIRIALPAAMALAADPIASLVDTAFIGRLGPVEIAAVGVSIAIFNQASKVTIFPLVSITTSFVAEEETVGRIAREALKGESLEKASTKNNEMKELIPEDVVLENLEMGSGTMGKTEEVVPEDGFSYANTSSKVFDSKIAWCSGSPPLLGYARGVPRYLISLILLIKLMKQVDLLPPSVGDLQFSRFLKNVIWGTGFLLLARVIAATFCVTLAASLAARLGPTPMAAFQVWMTSSLLADGLAVAGQAILACAFAEKDYEKAKAAANRVLQMGFVLGLGLALVVGLGLQFGSGIFSKDKNVIRLISIGVPFVAATQPINSLAFVFDGVNFGASDFAYSAYSMVAVAIVSIASIFVLYKADGFVGLWVALTIYMALRTVAGWGRERDPGDFSGGRL